MTYAHVHAAGLSLLLAATIARGDTGLDGGGALHLAVDLADGSRLVGVPTVSSIPMNTSVGRIMIPLAQVSTIRIADSSSEAMLVLTNDDHLRGTFQIDGLTLTTLFGEVRIQTPLMRRIARVAASGHGASPRGLVFWNTLESEGAARESRVGPDGRFSGGRFVAGRFGNGVELSMQEPCGISFPDELVARDAGCVEFWARLVDFPQMISGGEMGLLTMESEAGERQSMFGFNGNDGAGNAGLCIRIHEIGSAGTGAFGNWTYARALGTADIGGWHHYALVWNVAGIAGVGDGRCKMMAFVDGQPNTASWSGACPAPEKVIVPPAGRLGLLSHQSMAGGRIVFDNLKIWDYDKTDFRDRNEE